MRLIGGAVSECLSGSMNPSVSQVASTPSGIELNSPITWSGRLSQTTLSTIAARPGEVQPATRRSRQVPADLASVQRGDCPSPDRPAAPGGPWCAPVGIRRGRVRRPRRRSPRHRPASLSMNSQSTSREAPPSIATPPRKALLPSKRQRTKPGAASCARTALVVAAVPEDQVLEVDGRRTRSPATVASTRLRRGS